MERSSLEVIGLFSPVNGDVIRNMIDHLNNQPVAFSSDNTRPWELPVHCHQALPMAQSSHVRHFYLSRYHALHAKTKNK